VLAVHEFVDAGFGTGPRSAVVNLGGKVEHDPNIATAIGVRDSVRRSGNDLVHLSRLRVAPPPFPMPPIVTVALDLVDLFVPVRIRKDRRIIVFLDQVVAWGSEVKVEAPIDMVIVHVADAGIAHCRELEAWTYGAVGMEAPLLYVTIPAGLHFRGEDELAFRL